VYSIITQEGNEVGIETKDDLCGLTLSTTTASGEAVAIQSLSDACVEEGLEPIVLDEYGEQAATFLAVQSGRADATLTDGFSSRSLLEENPDTYADVLSIEGTTLWGVAVPVSNTELIERVKEGVAAALEDGSLAAVLEGYDVDPSILVPGLTVNGELVA
jgi:polar amino acid transport system substrate-binding protein